MPRATTAAAVIGLLVGMIAAGFAIFLWKSWPIALVLAIVFWVASYFLIATPNRERPPGPP